MYLTLADSGNRRLTIRGPPGVSHFLSAGKAFCENRQDSELRAAEINFSSPTDALLHDNLVSIQPVPILPATEPDPLVSGNGVARHQLSGGVSGGEDADEEEDADGEGDLRKAGAGEQARRESRSPKDRADQAKAKSQRQRSSGYEAPYCAASVSYVLRFADQAGRMDVSKAVSLGVPKGPLLGKLKGGQAVTLPDGRVVEPSACVEGGTAGAVVVLLACPSIQHVAPLAGHQAWNALPPAPTGSPLTPEEGKSAGMAGQVRPVQADLVVHFGGMEVLCDKRYVELTRRLAATKNATHVLLHQTVCEPEVVFPSQVLSLFCGRHRSVADTASRHAARVPHAPFCVNCNFRRARVERRAGGAMRCNVRVFVWGGQ